MNDEYQELPLNNNIEKRKEYWAIGKGLQKVDNLETSEYLETIIDDTNNDRYDTITANKKVEDYYSKLDSNDPDYEKKEADLSATRITILLEQGGFKYSPITLKTIHSKIFPGILESKYVGEYRNTNISKKESILNGNSVQYANYTDIQETLKYDFDVQLESKYSLPITEEQIKTLMTFTSNIWQTHPFREGNTRTVSTFLILYLRNMGININNEPFKENADYFRNALVRNNYTSIKDGINAEPKYLYMFFENILLDAGYDLSKYDLRCKELF